jgi:hypothetical protein
MTLSWSWDGRCGFREMVLCEPLHRSLIDQPSPLQRENETTILDELNCSVMMCDDMIWSSEPILFPLAKVSNYSLKFLDTLLDDYIM